MTDPTPALRPGRRMGRPSKIDEVVWVHEDGTHETAGDRIINVIERGMSIKDACLEAGVVKATLHGWRNKGAIARAAADEGQEITESDARYVDFLNRLERARITWEMATIQKIQDAATNPQVVKKVTVRKALNENGVMVEVERTEHVEERPPLWTAAGWLAERILPAKYGRRLDVTTQASDTSADEDRIRALSDEADAFLLGVSEGAASAVVIEVESIEAE